MENSRVRRVERLTLPNIARRRAERERLVQHAKRAANVVEELVVFEELELKNDCNNA